jgi:hypothetical protein
LTQASLSPSSPTGRLHFAAGPLDIALASPAGGLTDTIAALLALYDVTWTLGSAKPVSLDCTIDLGEAQKPAQGRYLECARMNVDPAPDGLRATTTHGAALEGTFTDSGESWRMSVPRQVVETGWWPEVEDLLTLVLTSGWRRAGWVPLHGAALSDGLRGAIVCAAGGGGKTTFMMAMVRVGWRSLGDDKLLLRGDGSQTLVAALKLMLNVDPAVEMWFPEIGDLSGLPEYSAWTIKRRVALESLWPRSSQTTMRPTTIVALQRRPGARSFDIEPMDAGDTMATLLRQTVIPHDRAQARWIMSELAACASGAVGVRVIVGDGAYADPDGITRVAEALR